MIKTAEPKQRAIALFPCLTFILAATAMLLMSACGESPKTEDKNHFSSGIVDPDRPVLSGTAAFGDYSVDGPGTRRLITVADFPAPYATKSSNNQPAHAARPADAIPKAPAGFTVDLLLSGLHNGRKIITAPNGDLFIAESGPGHVRMLRQGPDGKIATDSVFATGLHQPFGIAFYPPGPNPNFVYVADTDGVVQFPYKNGDLVASDVSQKLCSVPGGAAGGRGALDARYRLFSGREKDVRVGRVAFEYQ